MFWFQFDHSSFLSQKTLFKVNYKFADFFRMISPDVQIQKNTFQREKSQTVRNKTKWTKF